MVKFYNKNYFNKYFLQLNYFLIILFINYNNSSIQENSENVQIKGEWCPDGCSCTTESPTTLDCSGLDLDTIPPTWPSHFEIFYIRNWTINSLEKQAFRRFQHLVEIYIFDCQRLDLIERNAFKQLRKLRVLVLKGNKGLRELYKTAFSGIGNEHPLSIKIMDNALERVRAFAFKNVENLRELIIEERCFELETNSLATITRVDFLTLKGVCSLEVGVFLNSSRLHQVIIVDSALSQLPKDGFAELSHLNQLQIRESRIGRISEGALSGLFTVGSVHFQSNQIGRLVPGWALGAENLGSLVFTYNTIREPLSSPDCLRNEAQRFLFTENTLYCSCEIQWLVNSPAEEQWLSENYCGREQAFKALLYYSPASAGCRWVLPPPSPPTFLITSTTLSTPNQTFNQQSPPMHNLRHQNPSQKEFEDNELFEPPSHQRRHSGKNAGVKRGEFCDKLIFILFFYIFYYFLG
ncbi:unnamed protein product [Meloidogyne enterolobii]|uniref:Uncharacterized protein n=1 Tax=Meloidogyne enterolobii TaxID=390850 RepID=A0ACB0YCD8_MELEN